MRRGSERQPTPFAQDACTSLSTLLPPALLTHRTFFSLPPSASTAGSASASRFFFLGFFSLPLAASAAGSSAAAAAAAALSFCRRARGRTEHGRHG